MSVDQVTQGVAGLQVTGGRRKKPARAFHDLQQIQPQQQITQPAYGGQIPQPQTQFNQFAPPNGFQGQSNPSSPNVFPVNQFDQQQQQQQQRPQVNQQESNVPQSTNGESLSVPNSRRINEDEWRNNIFKSFENTLPPSATTKYQAFDQSISTPKFTRLSLYQIPISEQIRELTKLPLGLTVRPFAPIDENEEQIPVIDTTETNGPIRCHRCRGYLNPLVSFTHDGKFICNLCKFSNTVPTEYYCPLGPDGRRQDYYQRPELYKGTVDFLVPKEYWDQENIEPKPLHFIFLIDVSASNEIIQATTEGIKASLYSLPAGCKIGIITYDDKIQFYNLNADLPSVHIVSDIEDPFIPIYDGLFVDPQENYLQVTSTLMKIDELYSNYKSGRITYGSAIKVAGLALKEVGGGKIIANITKSPSIGPGFLHNTDNVDRGGPITFRMENEYYVNLSKEFITNNVTLDLFVLSQSSIDMKNSASPVFKTAGSLKLYPRFSVDKDEFTYIQDITQSVKNTVGYQGQFKTRCSNGLQVRNYYGNFDAFQDTDPKLPVLSSDQEVSVLFKYDSKLNIKEDFSFQTAVLYTDSQGIRKVRVINSIAAVTDSVSKVFAFADQDTILNVIIKNCIYHLNKQHSNEIKNQTTEKLIEIFFQYRAIVTSNANMGQLILPDSLNTLTSFISSFQKTKIFRTNIDNNLKFYDYYKLNALPTNKLLLQLYPRIIELHNLQETDCEIDENGNFNMPINLRASAQFIQAGGCYLIFNGEKLFIYIHQQVNPLLLSDLFNVNNLQELSPSLNHLPSIDSEISQKTSKLIKYFQNYLKLNELPVSLIRQGIDHLEFEFSELLVEDRSIDKTPSFVELVQKIHKSIKDNLQNGRTSGSASSDNNSSYTTSRGNTLDVHTLGQSFAHI